MPKSTTILKVINIDYSPKAWDKASGELIVWLYCVDRSGNAITLKLLDTKPHFWAKQHPDDVDLDIDVTLITDVKKQGKTTLGEPLYCIYTKYPFDVPSVRQHFEWTGQSKIPYRDAIRLFHGIKSCIKVPTECINKGWLYPSDIIPVDNCNDIKSNDSILDIETGDKDGFAEPKYPTAPIRCLTILDVKTKKIYHGTTYEVDEDVVKSFLSDEKMLKENVTIGDDSDVKVPPISPDRIVIKKFTNYINPKFEDEEKEGSLVEWAHDMLAHNDTNIIIEHGDYDWGYITGRTRNKNSAISKWNKNHPDSIQRSFWVKPSSRYLIFDFMMGFKKLRETDVEVEGRNALGWIGEVELGYGKIVRDKIDVMLENDPERLSAYNIWDCELVLRIDEKKRIMDFCKRLTEFAGTCLDKIKMNMNMAEFLVMHRINPHEILPSIDNLGEITYPELGAYVHDAPKGLHKGVIELDLKGEYAGVIMSGNIDTKTRLKPDEKYNGKFSVIPITGRRYKLEPLGLIPQIERDLTNMRDTIKDKDRNRVIKFFMHSFTGIMGSGKGKAGRPSTLVDGEAFTDIIYTSREHLKWNKVRLESFTLDYKGKTLYFEVIYQDTDSCKCIIKNPEGIPFEKDVYEEIGNKLADMLNKSYDEFAKKVLKVIKHYFKVKVDSISKAYYQWEKKKRYAYLTWDDKIEYRGVEIRRSNSSWLTKYVQTNFFDMLLHGKDLITIGEFFARLENNVLDGVYSWECGKPQGVSKVSDTSQQYKAMGWSNEHLGKKFIVGDKPVLFYVKAVEGKPYPPNGVVSLDWKDNPKDFGLTLDYKKIVQKSLVEPMNHILAGLDTTWDKMKIGMKEQEVEDEF